ncbi:MAG: hypothetical protein O3C23_01845 [bacterium]|nr:hypothetical protein [bacterium]
MNNNLRTQILLPAKLREEIEKARRKTKESLAEYLRKAAKERLEKTEKSKTNLKRLAKEVVGSVKKSAWEGLDAVEWQRQMREDRD